MSPAPTLDRPRPAAPARARGPVDLVLLGSSTGGPSALEEVLAALPRDFAAPVVVAQHLPSSFTRALATRLDARSEVVVREVHRAVRLRPGVVYVGRGGSDVVVARRPEGLVVRSVAASSEHRWHPSVDRLVASALAHCPDPARLVGVLLTGMGDDGAAQMTRLRALGGRAIAESKRTAVVHGMPAALERRGGADLVLPLPAIGPRLAAWGRDDRPPC